MHAPQVTQSQMLSSGTAPGTSGVSLSSANTASRSPMMTSLGERILPVA